MLNGTALHNKLFPTQTAHAVPLQNVQLRPPVQVAYSPTPGQLFSRGGEALRGTLRGREGLGLSPNNSSRGNLDISVIVVKPQLPYP